MTTELEIHGMHCGACARRVGNALRGVPFVESVTVSLAENKATVEHRAEADVPEMIGALGHEGFRAISAPRSE